MTALFRHPLGLPIPHTAILPAQKDRLGRALGGFVANHVFTEADIDRALARIDLPLLVQGVLLDPHVGEMAQGAAARMIPHLLDGLEAGRARDLLARLLPRLLNNRELAPVVGRGRGAPGGGAPPPAGAIEGDLVQPDSWIARLVAESLERTGEVLGQDRAVREAIDRAARTLARRALPGMRSRLAGFIADVVAGWDARLLVDRLELRVGRDLQFVRINGTLVGALVGGVLYLCLRLVFGAASG